MSTSEQLAGEMVLTAVHDTLRAWFAAGVEHVGLANGFPVETFTAQDPPCRLQSARLRGLEVLHLNNDMRALANAIVRSLNHVCADALADIEAQGFAALPQQRGTA